MSISGIPWMNQSWKRISPSSESMGKVGVAIGSAKLQLEAIMAVIITGFRLTSKLEASTSTRGRDYAESTGVV